MMKQELHFKGLLRGSLHLEESPFIKEEPKY